LIILAISLCLIPTRLSTELQAPLLNFIKPAAVILKKGVLLSSRQLSKPGRFNPRQGREKNAELNYALGLARVGGFHMQGISGRSHSRLLQALNNAADGSLQLALRVKIDEKKRFPSFFSI